jgi:NTE family protein
LLGAYSVLQEKGYRSRRVAGTSAGAIVGALIAAEMPADEMERVMRTIDYRRFQDEDLLDRIPLLGKGLSIVLRKGIYQGTYLRDWLDGLLTDLDKRTWAQLRIDDEDSSLPPDQRYKLVVMASDISRGELVRLPWDYRRYGLEPDEQLVADAVRASMSIPLFYEPARLRDSYVVDGGMLSNFPVGVFDRRDENPPRWPTFGIKLSARPSSMQQQKFKVNSTLDLIHALVGTMTGFYDQMHIDDECVTKRTMFVDTTGIRATDFGIGKDTQDMLFSNGRAAAEGFLEGWNWETYLEECRRGR